jgi:CubicO group peptidase (beta-lactamase class C family)
MKKTLASLIILVISFSFAFAQPPTKEVKGYGPASYKDIQAGKFLTKWLVAGPVLISGTSPDEQAQNKFFNEELTSFPAITSGKKAAPFSIRGQNYQWQSVDQKDNIIDFDKLFSKDYAEAYALAEINSPSEQKTFLAVGSDDGVKVWLNGQLVHKNWMPRASAPDQDIVPITLKKGSNQLLIAVQDIEGGWSFVARFADKSVLASKLVQATSVGNVELVTTLLNAGADPNGKDERGISPIQAAKLSGRKSLIETLKSKGAADVPVGDPSVLVDALYKDRDDKYAPAASVLVAKDGKVVYKKAFGFADVDKKVKATPLTKFRIGSVTKQFTAAAILKLQEAGKLSVNDKLSTYLPDFPRGNEVTIHHLLTHTSGIHSYTNKDFIPKVTKPITSAELYNWFKDDPYDFNPGEQWLYNNSGYFLLGLIIEKVSGKSYEQYLKEQFFVPLKLNNTGVHAPTLKLENEAKPHTVENGKYVMALDWDMSWANSAGALYSTVEDLYQWHEALFNGKVLSEASFKAFVTPVVLNDGNPPSFKYGYGIGMADYRKVPVYLHSGGLHGFLSQLATVPSERMTVVMLTNMSPGEVNLDPNPILEAYLWEKMPEQTSNIVSNDVVDVSKYVGRYDFTNGAVMIFSSEGGKLFAQMSGQGKFEVFPSGKDEFFWKVVDAKMKFVTDEKGQVTHGLFTQSGREINVKKLPDLKFVTIDPAIFTQYIGKYDYGNNFVIAITTEGDKFFAQATNQPKFQIHPLSEQEFALTVVDAKLIFVKETNGKVSAMVLEQGGMKRQGPKIE